MQINTYWHPDYYHAVRDAFQRTSGDLSTVDLCAFVAQANGLEKLTPQQMGRLLVHMRYVNVGPGRWRAPGRPSPVAQPAGGLQ